MAEPRILVLILAINRDPWREIEEEGQIPTWRGLCPSNVKIFRYIGDYQQHTFWRIRNKVWILNQRIKNFSGGKLSVFSINSKINRRRSHKSKVDWKNDQIITSVPDLYSLIGEKTLDAFEASIENFEFDYIFRTNTSSYVDLKGLQRFIEDKPKENFYAGTIGSHQNIKFASGCGYFISRDLVAKVVKNRILWDHNFVDDVSLGKLLTGDFNIDIHTVDRVDIDSLEMVVEQVKQSEFSTFHFRCKAAHPETTIQIMTTIHKLIGYKRKNIL
jgi:hypothetical protein